MKNSYVDGKKEGFGECRWEDGKKYIGEWKEGKQHGHGTVIYPDGTVKIGEWFNGVKLKAADGCKSKQQANSAGVIHLPPNHGSVATNGVSPGMFIQERRSQKHI